MFSILQALCVILVVSGLSYEIANHADAGYVLITGGSLLFAISVKVKKWRMEKERRL